MKDAGLKEVRSIRARVRKLWGMERVSRPDFEFIDKRMDEVEARIVSMTETDEYGKEVHG
jgi:hypothetical protein